MYLKEVTLKGFKSFASALTLKFPTQITAIVGPNGSGKSNITEAFRFVLGEQSMKMLRSRRGGDLIFNGGVGRTKSSKAEVTMVFDNSNNLFGDTFREVILKRIVHRDGSNEYYNNDTQVRHRDVVELLAKANIGATGHHIISQGQADRILNATLEERREMIEDGLGLKLLQYCKGEAEKKIQKTERNLERVESLQRELAPHMKYLKRQSDQYEKAQTLRDSLTKEYAVYLAHEQARLVAGKSVVEKEAKALQAKIASVDSAIDTEKQGTKDSTRAKTFKDNATSIRDALADIVAKKDELSRAVGRIEGQRDAHEVRGDSGDGGVPKHELQKLYTNIQERFHMAETIDEYKGIVTAVLDRLQKVLSGSGTAPQSSESIEKEYEKKKEELDAVVAQEKEYIQKQEALLQEQEVIIQSAKTSEQALLKLVTEKNGFEQALAEVRHTTELFQQDTEELQREITEGKALIGNRVNDYKEMSVTITGDVTAVRKEQRERRRDLERKKIQLESLEGTGCNQGVYKEYERLQERDAFLQKEKDDIRKGIADLEDTIKTLQRDIDTRFKSGMRAINTEFGKFYKTLFGGGKARVETVTIEPRKVADDDDTEVEKAVGVDIRVSLPHKKITDLEQLSGGERALISIALLFAISQVTPPPFLILDETDAALDESNSRRYGEMIKALSKKSQLILITHNRETMYAAGALYGITMDSMGASTILSIKFDEAVQVAK